MDEKNLTGKELKLYQAEQRLKRQRANLAETRRKRDTHAKCQVAGKLFNALGIAELAMKLDSPKQVNALVQVCFTMIDRIANNKDLTATFSEAAKEAVKKAIEEEENLRQAKRAAKQAKKDSQ